MPKKTWMIKEHHEIKGKPKIAVIGPLLTSSGSSTHTKNIVKGLNELGTWEVILITYMEPNAVVSKVKAPNIATNNDFSLKKERVFILPLKKDSNEEIELPVKTYVFEEVVTPQKIHEFSSFIKQVILSEKITVLHPQTKPFVLFSTVNAVASLNNSLKRSLRIIATWHSNFGWIKDAKYHLALALKSAPLVDGFIPVSQNVKQDLQEILNVSGEKILQIIPPGGIDLEKVQKPRTEILTSLKTKIGISDKYIVFLGRMLYNKGVDVLLKAYSMVIEEIPSIDLVIIGTGPFKKDFVKLAEDLGLTGIDVENNRVFNQTINKGKVVFTGFITDDEVYALLQGGTLFCLPSRWESFSISTLEAMGAGLPVVCSNVGGIPFWVGDAAVLVPPEDPVKTSKVIIDILNDPDKMSKLKEKSLLKAKEYHWKELARKTSHQIEKITSSKQHLKQWDDFLNNSDGIVFEKETGKIIISKKELTSNPKYALPSSMLITEEALFFPSETLEKNTYYRKQEN